MNHAELLREGYAYAGVSVQVAGVSGGPLALRAWDPVRDAPLTHPGDAYMHDILSQAARSLFERTGPDPLGGLDPRAVLAAARRPGSGSCVSRRWAARCRRPTASSTGCGRLPAAPTTTTRRSTTGPRCSPTTWPPPRWCARAVPAQRLHRGAVQSAGDRADAHLAAVRRAVDAAVAEGSLLAPEGARYLAEAEALDVWGDAPASGARPATCSLRGAPPQGTAPTVAPAPAAGIVGAGAASGSTLPATGSSSHAGIAAAVLVAALAAGVLRRRSEPVWVSAPRGAETLPHS